MTRLPLRAPFTTREEQVVEQLVAGRSVPAIARGLGLQLKTVRSYVRAAATKVPGDLPAVARIVVWSRGGSAAALGAP